MISNFSHPDSHIKYAGLEIMSIGFSKTFQESSARSFFASQIKKKRLPGNV